MLTEREKQLLEALEAAINTFEYASMTQWERETCEDDMRLARETRDKFRQEEA